MNPASSSDRRHPALASGPSRRAWWAIGAILAASVFLRRGAILTDAGAATWLLAALHAILFAFVLGVPLVALISEWAGRTRQGSDYDRLARELTRPALLLSVLLAVWAIVMALVAAASVDPLLEGAADSMLYAALVVAYTALLGLYLFTWDRWAARKTRHLALGGFAVVAGVAAQWVECASTMVRMTGESGLAHVHAAFQHPLWLPVSTHCVLTNMAFGGALVGAYGAAGFLSARGDQERTRFDWIGHAGAVLTATSVIPLPLTAYWVARGADLATAAQPSASLALVLGSLLTLQSLLVGVLLVGANLYLWTGIRRASAGGREARYVSALSLALVLCAGLWLAPSPVASAAAPGSDLPEAHWSLLGSLVAPARNTAVSLAALITFITFIVYRRATREPSAGRPVGRRTAGSIVTLFALIPTMYCAYAGWFSEAARAASTSPVLERQIGATRQQIIAASGEVFASQIDALRKLAAMEQELPRLAATPGLRRLGAYRVLAVLLLLFLGAASAAIAFGRAGSAAALQKVVIASGIGAVLYFGGAAQVSGSGIEYAPLQMALVGFTVACALGLDVFLLGGSPTAPGLAWGRIGIPSQYALLLEAFAVALLAGVTGLVRAGAVGSGVLPGAAGPSIVATSVGPPVVAVAAMLSVALFAAAVRFGDSLGKRFGLAGGGIVSREESR